MSNTLATETIAVIGLGAMGLPVARNLAVGEGGVVGCDLDPGRRTRFEEDGGRAVTLPRDLPTSVKTFFVLLPNPAITEAAIFGPDGLASTPGLLSEGKVVVNLGTIGPDAVLDLGKRLAELGTSILDLPMGKSSAAAEAGELSLLAAGDEQIFSAIRPLLDHISTEVVFCGELGLASTIKIVNNLVSSTIADVVAQALALGAASGAPLDLMIKSLSATGADNWHLRNTFPNKVAHRDFAPGFSVDLATKDMRIGLEMAAKRSIPLPTVSQSYQRYLQAQQDGYGQEDWGALAKVAEKSAGTELR
ncbi:NAD(P)-dependent oxidoreductase [Pseudarthrobacter sp. MDT3-26]|uniref:NAD(P)-dependent oxidoreductase n=1 Tax=Pseudarthrobacter raffinosi TaxID=2953651 RepID=UPI00208FA365|nr:NAD(P)-dependent oxidoreductase [Pseudarthrobacter sp. MDT3-26]MCO4262513.1 NAD(P)-dependent oxidoreductase [Pseudarthrobacter sp. MDT3-26]